MISLGCKDPVSISSGWPLGLDVVWGLRQNASDGLILLWFNQYFRKFGNTIKIEILGFTEISTIEPANIEAILSTHFEDYGVEFRADHGPFAFFGDGILSQDGAAWKHSRELMRRHFRRGRPETLEICRGSVDELIATIPTDQALNFQSLFERLMLDITLKTVFNSKPDAIAHHDSKDISDFSNAMNLVYKYLGGQSGWLDQYWITGRGTFSKAVKTCHSFVDSHIKEFEDEYQETSTDHHLESPGPSPYLPLLLADNPKINKRRESILQLFLASRDTTATLLHWTFLLLARNPSVEQEIREEISNVLDGSAIRPQDAAELKKLKYLGFTLKEVLRLFPPVSVNNRAALKETKLPLGGGADGKSPVLLMPGDFVGYNIFSMHRRKDLYGPDADIFRPSRWDPETESGLRLKHIGMGYLPFHGGPRVCLGQEVALLQASYIVVRLLETYAGIKEIKSPKASSLGEERVDVKFLMSPHKNYQLEFRKSV
ncbi:MAG: hypothetical protein M1814_001492 [Vezdaea aestivalis]|nr:MAG: hypothetical protein M1814_001492 [Vezdaea aestivalis]